MSVPDEKESTMKVIADLSESVKVVKAELETLKCGATDSGSDPQASMQDSVNEPGQGPPQAKRLGKDDSDIEEEEESEAEIPLVPLSEAANAYLASAKLDNSSRKSKGTKFGTPDSHWIRCPKMDAVVMANVSKEAERIDCAASWLQLFWLDAVTPLVMLLERDEELQLPAEAIQMVQTSILLMGNASFHHSMERRRALLQHLNPQLKQLVEESDFKDAASMLFGDNFGAIAKQRLEAAAALKKTLAPGKWKQGSHPQQNRGCGGGKPLTSGQERG